VLSLSVQAGDGVATIDVAGELDLLSAPNLREAAMGALEDGATSVVLDCSKLTFIDSCGLSVMLEAARVAHEQSGYVTVAQPSPLVRRLLHITGLNQTLRVEP
jgi:anti-sigma B factor antagonist